MNHILLQSIPEYDRVIYCSTRFDNWHRSWIVFKYLILYDDDLRQNLEIWWISQRSAEVLDISVIPSVKNNHKAMQHLYSEFKKNIGNASIQKFSQ